MPNSNDSSTFPDPSPDDGRWRRLLDLLAQLVQRHRADRDTADSIWRSEQDRQEAARAELIGLVRTLLRVVLPVAVLAGVALDELVRVVLRHLHP